MKRNIKKSAAFTLRIRKNKRSNCNKLASQRKRILKHFEVCPRLSTFEAREKLQIMHPGGRVCELRKMGHRIITQMIYAEDSSGLQHKIGQYIYQGRLVNE